MILHTEGRWQQRVTLMDAGEAILLRSVEVCTLDLMEFICVKFSVVLFHIHASTFLVSDQLLLWPFTLGFKLLCTFFFTI